MRQKGKMQKKVSGVRNVKCNTVLRRMPHNFFFNYFLYIIFFYDFLAFRNELLTVLSNKHIIIPQFL